MTVPLSNSSSRDPLEVRSGRITVPDIAQRLDIGRRAEPAATPVDSFERGDGDKLDGVML